MEARGPLIEVPAEVAAEVPGFERLHDRVRLACERYVAAWQTWVADVRGRTPKDLEEQHRRADLARGAEINILRVALDNIAQWSRVRD